MKKTSFNDELRRAAAAAPKRKGLLFEKVDRMMANLNAKIAGGDVKALIATVNEQKATITRQEERIRELESAAGSGDVVTQLRSQIADLENSKTSLSQSTIDQVAALGFEASKLPAATSGDVELQAPTSLQAFAAQHAELSKTDSKAASEFYTKFASKFGL